MQASLFLVMYLPAFLIALDLDEVFAYATFINNYVLMQQWGFVLECVLPHRHVVDLPTWLPQVANPKPSTESIMLDAPTTLLGVCFVTAIVSFL